MGTFEDKTLDNILKDAISAIENSKSQIFDIYEGARNEVDNILRDIERAKEQVNLIIERVDRLEAKERDARLKLVRVSSNFKIYSEEDIKICYDETKNIQIELAVVREQEQNLRRHRDELEIRLKQLQNTMEKAKQLVAQVGVVMGYLSAQMGAVVTQIESANQDKWVGAQIIKAQEDERLRVSREIHDGPAQLIANVIYRSSICERLIDIDTAKAKRELKDLREQIRSCLNETRRIIFDLRPMALDDLGLVATLHHFLDKFKSRAGIEVAFEIIGKARPLEKHVEISLFRLIQEALHNVEKHAQVDKAALVLEYGAEYVSVYIEDHGVGFLAENLKSEEKRADCYGLLGMQERVKILDGRLLIDSVLQHGTKLRILVPLKQEEGGGAKVEKVRKA